MQIFKFFDSERADLIRALEDAQNELAVGPGLPEGTGQWERWEALIRRLKEDGVSVGQTVAEK